MSTHTLTDPATARADAPTGDVLDDYDPSSFFLAGGGRTLLARDCEPAGPDTDAPLLVGALPFDPDSPAHLLAPRSVRQSGIGELSRGGPSNPVQGEWELRAEPSTVDFRTAVRAAVERMDRGELEKVVLSRTLRLTTSGRIDHRALLRALLGRDTGGYTFATPLPGTSGGSALIGATPELLVSKTGDLAVSHPLAGSRARAAEPAEDRRRATELLASEKDRREHDVVVRAVAEGLRPFCAELEIPAEPSLVDTPAMWHLGSRIVGRLADPHVSSVTLARALHPTPAVCGTPMRAALSAIGELEPGERGFYTGAVGWTDWTGDGEWLVAIRCAEVRQDQARLYAGAGLVPGSDPDDELGETTAKFRTLLRALGLEEG